MQLKRGGASNHRHGLHDMAMIKDNHIEVAGGITAAVKAVRSGVDHGIKIEVETTTLAQVQEAIDAKSRYYHARQYGFWTPCAKVSN